MSYKHLTINERAKIEVLQNQGYSLRKIANILNRSVSTISREIKRNSKENFYYAESAENNYHLRKKNCGRKSKLTNSLADIIVKHLKMHWSPEQIVGRLFQNHLTFKTIYRWINNQLLNFELIPYLRQKGKRQKPKETRGRFNIGKLISQRPKDVKQRSYIGHWEGDTVVSSRGKSKGCIATFAERKSRYYHCVRMPNRSSESMKFAMEDLINSFPPGNVKSITVDRGKEFACYKEIESKYGINIYFADPYSAWQRGTNENTNGLLREFFPKKTDLAKVKQSELLYALNSINNRPRKCLNWKTPYEVFNDGLLHLI